MRAIVQLAGCLAALLSGAALSMALSACGEPKGTAASSPAASPPPSTSAQGRLLAQCVECLGRFLANGPREGRWRVTSPSRVLTWHFQPVPDSDEEVFVSRINDLGLAEWTSVFPRQPLPRFLYEAPAWLFFANYELAGPLETVGGPDGSEVLRLSWRPRLGENGLTARTADFDPNGQTILRLEDRSRTGHLLRRVEHVEGIPPQVDPAVEAPCCGQISTAGDLSRALRAPFPIFEPEWLPPGFVRIRSDYDSGPLPGEGKAGDVRRATLLYSDGMALISLAMGPSRDIDAILAHYGRMSGREGDADSCPGLPAEPKDIQGGGGLVRMRTDACKTLLRRDGVGPGLSILVLGRNEVSLEAYLRVIEGLRAAQAP